MDKNKFMKSLKDLAFVVAKQAGTTAVQTTVFAYVSRKVNELCDAANPDKKTDKK